ncbi:hypothetical protein [Cellulomonas sp. ATA003]|uniref:hypothetical protein n=1 Tax=Cellulomonas sp. ATA003 TaxID=3073064 RepID=UPI0028737471|nr:hypothetical protein [Cellulomonas sp. ATA003]WNB87122.1 hypothetical protein REH70_08395 [Cellulomonas sp. ATA003]
MTERAGRDAMRRRRALAGTAGVAIAALASAWLVVGLNPRLEQGEVAWASEVVDTSDPDRGWTAVDPAPGEARVMASYRSTGPVPVRVAAVPDQPAVLRSEVSVLGERDVLLPEHAAPAVTVPRGGSVAVWQTLDFPCVDLGADSGVVVEHVLVDVTTLGITRRLELPLHPSAVTLRSSTDRVCPGG